MTMTTMMVETTGSHQELSTLASRSRSIRADGAGGGNNNNNNNGGGDADCDNNEEFRVDSDARQVQGQRDVGTKAPTVGEDVLLRCPGLVSPLTTTTTTTKISGAREAGDGYGCPRLAPGRPTPEPQPQLPACASSASPSPELTARRPHDEGLYPFLNSCHEDILCCVVEFLDLDSIANWSETNRRANRACQAFLRRQLRLKPPSAPSPAPQDEPIDDNDLSPSCLSVNEPNLDHVHQLSRMDNKVADRVFQEEFVQRKENRRRPHGLPFDDDLFGAYRDKFAALPARLHDAAAQLRAAFLDYARSGGESPELSDMAAAGTQRKMAAAAAAMLGTMACMAVASSCYEPGGAASAAHMASSCHLPSLELVEEMVTRLVKLGVMGTLMKGGAKAAAEAARARARVMAAHGSTTSGDSAEALASDPTTIESDAAKGALGVSEDEAADSPTPLDSPELTLRSDTARKVPSSTDANLIVRGCVGAYRRVLARCRDALRTKVKQTRKERFRTLASLDERQEVASRFMEACSHDDVRAVQRLINEIDVEGFYVSNDGTTTCGLHSAAFHNSCRVVEYLVTSGCCDVNLSDANGWTALHFAAGASALEATQLLLRHGGNDAQEAANGYTPLQWAERLQNASVLPVLRKARADRRQRWRRTHLHLSPFFVLLGEGFFDAVPHLLEMVAQTTILPARPQ